MPLLALFSLARFTDAVQLTVNLIIAISRIKCALCTVGEVMRNGLLRMRPNDKPPTENTRSPSALLR